jgi:glycine cleavage system H protein
MEYFYTKTHEWVSFYYHKVESIEKKFARVGITDFAVKELVDIVFFEFFDGILQKKIEVGQSFMILESIKIASDVYMPLTGIIIEINNELDLKKLKHNPYDEWFIKIDCTDCDEYGLMKIESYKQYISSEFNND